MRLLVTGAAGSGTSKPGQLLAPRLGLEFQEADDIYWLPSTPPFQHKRPYAEHHEMMDGVLSSARGIVVTGSVRSWGREIENAFDAIVFLTAPTQLRLERLKQRDIQRFGVVDSEFLDWAAQYDSGTMPGRSLASHNSWLADRTCPVLPLESIQEPGTLAQKVMWVARPRMTKPRRPPATFQLRQRRQNIRGSSIGVC